MSSLERSTMLGPFPLPAMDEALRERARALAGKNRWLAFEDPAVPVDGPLPKAAIQGGYEIDESGEFTGRYQINPEYRPSVRVAGMALSTVETVLWRTLHGYNPVGFLVDALYRAELAFYAYQGGDQQLHIARNASGHAVLTAFTSKRFIPASWTYHHVVPGWAFIETMGNSPVFLDLNPATPLSLQIMIRDMALLLTEQTRQSRNLGPIPMES